MQLMVAVKLTDSPVHLIGTSMGGGIAGVYASRYPDNVALLTLIGPTGKAGYAPDHRVGRPPPLTKSWD